jgi:hypothetical protein
MTTATVPVVGHPLVRTGRPRRLDWPARAFLISNRGAKRGAGTVEILRHISRGDVTRAPWRTTFTPEPRANRRDCKWAFYLMDVVRAVEPGYPLSEGWSAVNEARHLRVDLRFGSIWQLCHMQETQDMGTVPSPTTPAGRPSTSSAADRGGTRPHEAAGRTRWRPKGLLFVTLVSGDSTPSCGASWGAYMPSSVGTKASPAAGARRRGPARPARRRSERSPP